MTTQIGVQMYTVREFCKTPADIAATCKKLARMGFAAVQTSALGPIEVGALRKILDDNGLVCAATHIPPTDLKEPQKVLDYHATLGCKLTAIGGFGSQRRNKQEWQTLISDFNGPAKTLAAAGLRLGYHNHHHEFIPFALPEHPESISPTDTPWQLMIDSFVSDVWFELDTHWVQAGGADPAMWIGKLPGRVPAIHVKDFVLDVEKNRMFAEVGAGHLNWDAILAASKKAGVQWYLIERDSGPLDPFESLRISRENLLKMGLK
ncbi:MAG: sugar phosphate isomerase/epimerase [Phycisphaeraceae bacterium]|nr:sugar phosphate isomerase/epimerase [Phycisphaeraceae bacterium]